MKYILMMNANKANWEEFAKWSKEDLQRNVAFMRAFSKELREQGAFVATEGLGWPNEAKIVRGKEWRAGYRWRVPGVKGVSRGLLDY